MLVLENKGKARVRAEVCSGKVKIDAPRLSEICNVDTVDIRWGIVELPIWKWAKNTSSSKIKYMENREYEYGWKVS